MATLVSPGVSVSVVDESFYVSSAPSTVPLIFVASAENKQNSSGTGIAQGTISANDGQVWSITSQRDLTDTFGTPKFYTDTSGNPINAGEQNEYGLQAAYSLLGITSQVYVARAPIDLGSLTASSNIPTGSPVTGQNWINTAKTSFGIEVWNATGNGGRGSFSPVTPIIIDNSTTATLLVSGTGRPQDSVGVQGNFAVVLSSDNYNSFQQGVWYKSTATSNAWIPVGETTWNALGLSTTISPHTQYPTYTTATYTGSVWIKTTSPNYGAKWVLENYSGVTSSWAISNPALYNSSLQALYTLDPVGGGNNIPVGTVFVETDPNHYGLNGFGYHGTFKVWNRKSTGPTVVTGSATTATVNSVSSFYIRETLASTSTWGPSYNVVIPASTNTAAASLVASGIGTTGLTNVSASYSAATGQLTITHALGGDFELVNHTGTILASAGLTAGLANLYTAPSQDKDVNNNYYTNGLIGTNWAPLSFVAQTTAPVTTPENGTLWYDANFTDVDIMINNGSKWVGYRHYSGFIGGVNGLGYNGTDINGPIVSATAPTTQSTGAALSDGDIWVDTSDTDMYGQNVYVWDGLLLKWVAQTVTDHTSPNGWVFADARWSNTGTTTMETFMPISSMLTSDYVDVDAPNPALYPKGTRLWNLRRSGFNVKQYESGYINPLLTNTAYNSESMASYCLDRWVSASPNSNTGVGTFGRLAQRALVVKSLKALVDTNLLIRDTDTVNYNLIACPGYPELIADMASLNIDRGQTALVVGDTPFRLEANATDLSAWGNNTNNALDNGETGLVTYDDYTAVYYPSGYTTDNTGNYIVVPPSHMMLNTIVNSDNVSYPWFAPAGTNRGLISNATSVGYVDPTTSQFVPTSVYQGLRDTLAPLEINPIATIPGVGLVAYGQYTRAAEASALDRINVARLVAYLRRVLALAVKPYLFEPNDTQTRNEVKAAVESILTTLVGQRALNDFVVVCDSSNNTPTRIDQSQLWVDIAIEPIKAVEFIYIPLRLLNTGAIASGNLGAGFPGSSSGV